MSTTGNNRDNKLENVSNLLESEKSGEQSFKGLENVTASYDNILLVSDSPKLHSDNFYTGEQSEFESMLKPSMEAYKTQENTVEKLNKFGEDTLIIGLGLEMDLPYLQQRSSEEYNFEGNWWDNIDELEADVLLDRTSYEGAVSVPYNTEIQKWNPNNSGEDMYLLTQNNP